ncbi:MAG TPA: hypothetical protein ENJ87_10550, partial [Gammaproteobacteria bacterium]|nr:hypothetical protein [Gammaproteobacteria bacterium]
MKNTAKLILLIFSLSLPALSVADNLGDMADLDKQLKEVNKKLARGQFNGDELALWTKKAIKMKSAALLCVSNNESALLDLKQVMDGLGEKVKGEDIDVTKKRKVYQEKKEDIDKLLAK